MEKRKIPKSELVLSSKGSVYHLDLLPHQVADTIFLVGDPGRVAMMSSLFDGVDHVVENREFVTHTGRYNGRNYTVLSTGIGTDNIDIVINELDALVNIDFKKRQLKPDARKLRFIRVGTSGALQEQIQPGNTILTAIAGGLDNLMHYYGDTDKIVDQEISDRFEHHMKWGYPRNRILFTHGSRTLKDLFSKAGFIPGITLSAPGFYGPQGRSLRLSLSDPEYLEKVTSFRHGGWSISNFEMETSALYGLSALLGHEAITICLALANRISGKFITDYHPLMKDLLQRILTIFSTSDEAGPY
jgi:uridine phosphorylase